MNSSEKTRRFVQQLNQAHTKLIRDKDAKPQQDEIELTDDWEIVLDLKPDDVVKTALKDFQDYLSVCQKVKISLSSEKSQHKKDINTMCLNLSSSFQSPESFQLKVSRSKVVLTGADSRGVKNGLHYLEHLFNFRGGPFLKVGEEKKKRIFETKITYSVFGKIFDGPNDLKTYGNNYLNLISHYGYNGVFLYVDLFDYAISKIIPELSHPLAEKNLMALNEFIERASWYGIDVYILPNAPAFLQNNSIFKNHPEIKGAVTFHKRVCLCSSQKKVRDFYREVFSNIFYGCPGLSGLILIIGGECFFHCYTRPHPRPEEGTNCPVCGRRKPEEVVAELTNLIVDTAYQNSSKVKVMVWPYGVQFWSTSRYAFEFFKLLDKRAIITPNFETGDTFIRDGVKSSYFDYCISNIGPSKRFKKIANQSISQGHKLYVKTESAITIELSTLPYIPVLYRWQERYEKLAQCKVKGLIESWRLYGFTGSLSAEVGYWMSWQPHPDGEEILSRIASRVFGQQNTKEIQQAWRYFSEAFSYYPFSPMVTGGIYFKGPTYLGPAHPLIFNVQKEYNLVKLFHKICGSAAEINEKVIRKIYVSDLYWTQPFGVDMVISYFEKMRQSWGKGLKLFEEVCRKVPEIKRENAGKELGIASIIYSTIVTILNVARFYKFRDELFSKPTSLVKVKQITEKMISIAQKEIYNAENALKFVKDDYRLGYGFTYGIYYNDAMIRTKIGQVKEVIKEIQQYKTLYATHVRVDNPYYFGPSCEYNQY